MTTASNFARITANGTAWTYASHYGGKLLVFISTIILARLLTQEEFGIVGFALVVISLLEVLRDLGIGPALIYYKDDPDAAHTGFWLGIATAMMDISDGLSRDLPRLAAASGVGAVVDAGAVPIHDDAEGDLERALHEGEDFELLVAHAALEDGQREALAAAGVTLWPIGRLDEGPGVRLEDASGIHPLPTGGYDHLAG